MSKAKGKINTTLNMARWIQALRSGRYKQGKKALRTDVGYCCLGVPCQISRLGRWEKKSDEGDGSVHTFIANVGAEATGTLPYVVAAWLGLTDDNSGNYLNPLVFPAVEGGETIHAISANDNLGYTFKQIADGLEALYLPGKSAKKIVAQAKARADKAAARRIDAQQRAR